MGSTSAACSTYGVTPSRCSTVVSRTAVWISKPAPTRSAFHVDLGARGARLGALADSAADEPQLGEPTDVTIRFDGAWRRAGGIIDIPEVRATVAGAALSGALALRDLDTDPVVDLALGVRRLDFAQLLGTSGLAVPESLDMNARRQPRPGLGDDRRTGTWASSGPVLARGDARRLTSRRHARCLRRLRACAAISPSAPMTVLVRTAH